MQTLATVVQEFEVQRVVMSGNDFFYNRHEAITHLGGYNPQWLKPKGVVINEILSGRFRYYTKGSLLYPEKTYLEVVKLNALNASTWYVRTIHDGLLNNNLLSLPGSNESINRLTGLLYR